jgi:hypothetical protein
MGVKPDLTLNAEYRTRIFENRVPWKMFGPKRDKVIEDSRKLHTEDLHDVYSSTVVR